MVRFDAGGLKLTKNVPTTLYLIIKVTESVLVTNFISYEFLMMLEMLILIVFRQKNNDAPQLPT
jgi:hypothetical protein